LLPLLHLLMVLVQTGVLNSLTSAAAAAAAAAGLLRAPETVPCLTADRLQQTTPGHSLCWCRQRRHHPLGLLRCCRLHCAEIYRRQPHHELLLLLLLQASWMLLQVLVRVQVLALVLLLVLCCCC
jgi:hypothetical protein